MNHSIEKQPIEQSQSPPNAPEGTIPLSSFIPTRDLKELMALGQKGTPESVATLLGMLTPEVGLVDRKNVDYALSLVASDEGIEAIHQVLLEGRPIQRNYAALFFKRRGDVEVLIEAVELGSIDPEQAWGR